MLDDLADHIHRARVDAPMFPAGTGFQSEMFSCAGLVLFWFESHFVENLPPCILNPCLAPHFALIL